MAARSSKELFEAIIFFGKQAIAKEMRYSEFEAVLDGVVGITELANRQVNAAYVKITSALKVHSIVTFQIEFNDSGFADEDWNIPLRHLADNAGPGPDLGAGPIRLACRSQCSVSWYQRELWEPNQREIDHFQLLQEAITRNKLGLITDAEDDVPLVSAPPLIDVQEFEVDVPLMSDTVDMSSWEQTEESEAERTNLKLHEQATEFQAKVDLLIQRQKQTIQSMEEKYREEIEQVKRAMRNETQSYRHRGQDLEQQANQNKVLLEKLQARNTRIERDFIQAQEQAESHKDQFTTLKEEYLELLRNQRLADDDKTRLSIDLKERLTLQALEMDEQNDELVKHKTENAELRGEIDSYQRQVVNRSDSSSSELAELRTLVAQKQAETAELKTKLVGQSGDHERLGAQLEQLKLELAAVNQRSGALTSANLKMQEALKTTEFNAQDLEQRLRASRLENDKLVQDMAEAEDNAGATIEVFERMEKLELVFVAYHPGAGHISLPARQLEDYLDKPLGFAAQKCSVTLEHYKSWLLHYDGSECEECGVPVKRIDTPSDYQPGVNNRCSKHRLAGANVTLFRKSS
ncbi:hypothetical protein [Reinekea sp.]|jgi:hypothetical protein|uniref:hypothetical protein n=1 Tax=Reinekea sp. TaxID=1970455 RepID=UPI002A7F2EBD|nr:hypothetical protein [Reinekea sp.]